LIENFKGKDELEDQREENFFGEIIDDTKFVN
jgi:hypothetical protein